ncbi:MAG: DEAD/DEAH box helicase, partial [Myxococcales bacterium]|nr:DEAD/DEAH box helicase [Myxococcales bacterium]
HQGLRSHGPLPADELPPRLRVHAAPARAVLAALVARGRLLEGAFRPDGRGHEYCETEVLRRIRRRTLAALRHAVEPVDASVLGRFLLGWHGLATPDGRPPRGGPERLLEVIAQLEGVALPWSELEKRILPARVPGYHPRMLDELGAIGAVVWVGAGALGPKDGRVVLYRRERAATLLGDGAAYEAPSALHAALLDVLATRGASFLTELGLRVGSPPVRELVAALWDLVWAGLATNDTFGPLRSLGAPVKKKSAPGSLRVRPAGVGGVASIASGGRWSPVADLRLGQPAATERAHAVAASFLERYGVVSREAADAEGLAGGFSAIYPVLRAMEEMGKIRRGYFVEGLSGSQFALSGVVDRLRAEREPRADPDVRLLPSVDPANPYGALLPWPTPKDGALKPRRAAGTSVVLVDGRCALFAGPKAKRVTTFPAMEDPGIAAAAFRALAGLARERRTRLVQVEQIDGAPARGGPWQEALAAAGFAGDYRGMTLTPTGS